MSLSASTLSLDIDEVLARREIEEMADEDLGNEEVVYPGPEPIIWFHQDELLGLVDEEPLPEDFSVEPVNGPDDMEWFDIEDVDLYEDGEMDSSSSYSEAESIDWDDLLEGPHFHVGDDIDEWNRFVAPAG